MGVKKKKEGRYEKLASEEGRKYVGSGPFNLPRAKITRATCASTFRHRGQPARPAQVLMSLLQNEDQYRLPITQNYFSSASNRSDSRKPLPPFIPAGNYVAIIPWNYNYNRFSARLKSIPSSEEIEPTIIEPRSGEFPDPSF